MNPESAPLPPDDLTRRLAVARSDEDEKLAHVGLAGGTYTVLLTGKDTGGRYCLIEMRVPPGGGPRPHRHDFEESFTVLEGEIEVTFRGEVAVLRTGDSANIPANAPHQFRNVADRPARLLCVCAPAGQEEFFLALGTPVPTRTATPPPLSEAAQEALKQKAAALAAEFRTEFL